MHIIAWHVCFITYSIRIKILLFEHCIRSRLAPILIILRPNHTIHNFSKVVWSNTYSFSFVWYETFLIIIARFHRNFILINSCRIWNLILFRLIVLEVVGIVLIKLNDHWRHSLLIVLLWYLFILIPNIHTKRILFRWLSLILLHCRYLLLKLHLDLLMHLLLHYHVVQLLILAKSTDTTAVRFNATAVRSNATTTMRVGIIWSTITIWIIVLHIQFHAFAE